MAVINVRITNPNVEYNTLQMSNTKYHVTKYLLQHNSCHIHNDHNIRKRSLQNMNQSIIKPDILSDTLTTIVALKLVQTKIYHHNISRHYLPSHHPLTTQSPLHNHHHATITTQSPVIHHHAVTITQSSPLNNNHYAVIIQSSHTTITTQSTLHNHHYVVTTMQSSPKLYFIRDI